MTILCSTFWGKRETGLWDLCGIVPLSDWVDLFFYTLPLGKETVHCSGHESTYPLLAMRCGASGCLLCRPGGWRGCRLAGGRKICRLRLARGGIDPFRCLTRLWRVWLSLDAIQATYCMSGW
jgi:hypothetical protein